MHVRVYGVLCVGQVVHNLEEIPAMANIIHLLKPDKVRQLALLSSLIHLHITFTVHLQTLLCP
jgi:hypothetical protein